jgi:hypothetical protein
MIWRMPLGGSSSTSLAEDEELLRGVLSEQKSSLLRYNRRVAGFSAGTANAPARPFSHQLNSAQIRGFFYVDSRYADAPGHDYQAQQ